MMISKGAATFVPGDFLKTPVWQHVPETALGPDQDESWMTPVSALPVTALADHAVGVAITLADGTSAFAVVFGTLIGAPELNALTQSFVFLRNGERCSWKPSGGIGMANASQVVAFLGKSQEQVFPFVCDLAPHAIGTAGVLRHVVTAESLSRREPWEIAMEVANYLMKQGRR